MSDSVDFKSIELFPGKNVADVMKEIYDRSKEKEDDIGTVISNITPLINTPQNVAMLGETLANYIKAGISNDDQLIKLITVVQKLMGKPEDTQSNNIFNLTTEEQKKLTEEYSDIIHGDKKIENTLKELQETNDIVIDPEEKESKEE